METVLVLLWTAWRVEEMGRLEEPDRVPRPSACAGGALGCAHAARSVGGAWWLIGFESRLFFPKSCNPPLL